MNLDENVETILTMFQNSQSDPISVSEVIEEDVKKWLDLCNVQEISHYFLTHGLHFKKIIFVDMQKLLSNLKQKSQAADTTTNNRTLFGSQGIRNFSKLILALLVLI